MIPTGDMGERVVAHAESGGWAERVAVAVEKVATVPPQVSVQTAAALPLAGITALRLLRACGCLHPEIGVRRNWRHTNEVIAALLDRRVRGNAILTTDT